MKNLNNSKCLFGLIIAACSFLPAAFAANPPGVAVTMDPAVALTNYTGMGEWNTSGNFEGWTTTGVSGATVSGGVVSGTASGSNPQLKLINVAGGPDLDLAYNDYMDVRLQVPAGFGGAVQVYYGATNHYYGTSNSITGFNATNRVVTLNSLATDGAFHVYRIFWGADIYWRGNLSDVRVDPLGTNASVGQAFALDYVRLGDLTGDVFTNSITSTRPAGNGVNTNTVTGMITYSMESKHFRFLWDGTSLANGAWTADMPHGTLRNFEEAYKDHVWRLGFRDPCVYPAKNGARFRISVTSYFSGYWMGGDEQGVVSLNMTPDGLRVEPPTWVPPHEFGHGCQSMANTNGTQLAGHFWENNANYDREQWMYYYPWAGGVGGSASLSDLWSGAATGNGSGIANLYSANAHWWIGMSRAYYECWPFWLYMDENPDNLTGMGSTYGNYSSTRVWKEALPGEYIWDTMHRLWPSVSLKDFFGGMARHNVSWDYAHRTALTNSYANDGYDPEWVKKNAYVELHQRADDPTWWQVPLAMAPQQTGYNLIRLLPQGSGSGRVVSVNFHGLADSKRGADWRASLVVLSDTAAVRYSTMWDAGTNSVTLAANENTVYLVVAGTPDNFLAEDWDDLKYPYQTSPEKQRFPYEVQVTGATPLESTNSTAGLVQLPAGQGGGWKSSTSTVSATAYVGPNARVLGNAQVLNNAKILDYAVVEDNAVVQDNAVVSGHALVRGSAKVRDNGKVRDYAVIGQAYNGGGTDTVSGSARALEFARFDGSAVITNWSTAKGCVFIWHDNGASTNVQGSGDAVLDGDYLGALSPTNGFEFGSMPYSAGVQSWIDSRSAPRRIYADYEFVEPNDSLAKDYYGTSDGYLQGSPAWLATDGTFSGFVGFNGVNQYVILDRSISDTPEITVAAWVRWSGGTSNQPVWYFGTATTNCMYLTPNDGTGHAKFSITSGGVTQTLSASSALPVGVWTHVALSLSNAVTGRLYINGTSVASGSITIKPDQLNAANANTTSQQNYLARGAGSTLPFYNGYLDSVRIYTGPLTTAEIAALAVTPVPIPTLVRNITPTTGLLFSSVTETFPSHGTTGNWQTYLPAGQSLNVIAGGPTVTQLGTALWEFNSNPDTGYELIDPAVGGYYASPIPIGTGVSIVTAVEPVRTGTGSPAFDFVVAIFHQRISLGVDNFTGQIIVFRNGVSTYGPVIANGQKTILSLVVQNSGAFAVYTNGVQAMNVTTTSSLNSRLNPDLTQDNAGWGADQSWTHYICVGREYPDGWSSFNGYIGDVFVYTNALSTTDRQSLEADLTKKFITPNTAPKISAIGNLGVAIPMNGNTGPLAFTVSDAETPASNLVVSATSGNTTLVPNANIVFGGGGTNRTVTVTPAATRTGSAPITVMISDGSLATSSQFLLTVTNGSITTYTITASAGTGGTISPSGSVVVNSGANQSFTVTPSSGYGVSNVIVDGSAVGALTSYTFSNVTANHTINASFTNTTVAATNPVVWWKFDEGSGTAANDSSGNGVNAALQASATWVPGILSSAVHLDGSANGYVLAPAGAVNALNNFSISTWVLVDTNAMWARVFDFGSGTGTYMFLTPQSGANTFRYAITTTGGGGEQIIDSTTVLSPGIWHHVAVTLTNTTGTLYVDGVAVGTNSSMTLAPSALGSTTQNYIGKSQYPDPNLMGAVDDFRIYSRALTAAEISTLANAGLPSPWADADIGVVGLAGTAVYTNTTYAIQAAGTNVNGTTDALRFVYQASSADCSNTVRVVTVPNTAANAKAGVVIRESLAANAREAGIWVTPTNGLVFTTRTTTGGATTSTTSTGKSAPYYVRIRRVGNSFRAYYSANGTTWTQLGSSTTIAMSTSADIGMGVESGSTNTLNTATMDHVTTVP